MLAICLMIVNMTYAFLPLLLIYIFACLSADQFWTSHSEPGDVGDLMTLKYFKGVLFNVTRKGHCIVKKLYFHILFLQLPFVDFAFSLTSVGWSRVKGSNWEVGLWDPTWKLSIKSNNVYLSKKVPVFSSRRRMHKGSLLPHARCTPGTNVNVR